MCHAGPIVTTESIAMPTHRPSAPGGATGRDSPHPNPNPRRLLDNSPRTVGNLIDRSP
jgi:hypothetical protein